MTLTFWKSQLKSQLRLVSLLLFASLVVPPISGQSDKTVQDVSFCMLSKRPADYVGQRIRIQGVFRFALEEEVLEQATCCPDKKLNRIRVSIDGNPMYPDAHSQGLIRELFRESSGVSLVVFVGTFVGTTLKVEKVERIDRLARPHDIDHDPAWVPRKCPQNAESTEQIVTPALNHEPGRLDPPKQQ